MAAYLINKDFSISRIEGTTMEVLHKHWSWDYAAYDNDNDVWFNDEGLFDAGAILAWIGPNRRIPLPAYLMGTYGEASGDPKIDIDKVQFGPITR